MLMIYKLIKFSVLLNFFCAEVAVFLEHYNKITHAVTFIHI